MSASVGQTTVTGRFLALAKTIKFAWFVGHFLVVVSSGFYWISLKSTSLTDTWYRLTFIGAMESFGVLVYQTYGKALRPRTQQERTANAGGSAPFSFRQVTRDENVLYFLLSAAWLVLGARVPVATVPFFIISLFHALTYIVTDVAPNVLQIQDVAKHPYLRFIDSLVTENHETSLNAICNSELLCLLYAVLRLLFFRPGSLLGFVAMFLFVRFKCYNSAHMKRSISKWEVRLDGLIAHPSVPSQLKSHYTNAKLLLRRYLALPSEPKSKTKTN